MFPYYSCLQYYWYFILYDVITDLFYVRSKNFRTYTLFLYFTCIGKISQDGSSAGQGQPLSDCWDYGGQYRSWNQQKYLYGKHTAAP